MSSPKTDFLSKYIVSGYTTLVGTEDMPFWTGRPHGVTVLKDPNQLSGVSTEGILILAEVLQKVDEPRQLLAKAKEKAPRLVLTVPNEYGWDEKFKPLKNPQHKRAYDADDLASVLAGAGLKYRMQLIDFAGWSFFGIEAT